MRWCRPASWITSRWPARGARRSRLIQVDGLSFRYAGRRRPALQEVSLRVERGESLLVLGPSGCGKSTLALCLNGAIPHFLEGELQGRVLIDGRDTREASMADLARSVGIVFQDPEAQFCMLTVEEEVAFGLENLAVPRSEMDGRIDQALGWVGLAHRRQEPIERLSGGQKQRLALGRGLLAAKHVGLVLLDEATSSVDAATEAEIYDRVMSAFAGACIVSSVHRLHLLRRFDTVIVMDDGRIVDSGTPDEVRQRQPELFAHASLGPVAETRAA
jgi:energy-coupling factor transporter ATP-binding protein EcfA2